MLRQSASLIWEAALLSSRRCSQLERAVGVATCDLAAACWDSPESPGATTGATVSTSYRVHQGNAAAWDTTFDLGGRRWKQTWQKEIAQRSAMYGKARGGEGDKQEGASRGSILNHPQSAAPESLALPPSSSLFKKESAPAGWRQLALRVMGYYTPESRVARGSTALFEHITVQVLNERLYQAVHLPVTFRTTYSLLVLHVWLCLVRLRKDGPERGAPVGQMLYDLFQHDVEKRVVKEGVTMNTSAYLRDLEKYFYGAASAYDDATAPTAAAGDLPQALWRNVLAEEGEPRELPAGPRTRDAEILAAYVRRELASLEMTDSDSFLNGNIKFHDDFGNH
ncbi:hypothetical protein KFL_003920080 [Klebsormidium nitens]|uniref:Ubiquinol-cytochrome c chaperone domain-containing protein n=1 Tax=Klebsormidium nitens TaxID=105231 RepID=A0A1Y1IEX2_KLENI|nr:hypothetical protein KFL_003920080 [Klebsormidium nitens]|eukprot:GAQ87989.1 hypothetical protein KFL_003920080 [Klebsormidium nitens]